MPNKPPRFGGKPSRPREYNRPSAAARLYGAAWRAERLDWLREHPLCVECEAAGLLTPATIVDHSVPHKGDVKLFWDKTKWQSMCKPHHDAKTAKEDGGFGRAPASEW